MQVDNHPRNPRLLQTSCGRAFVIPSSLPRPVPIVPYSGTGVNQKPGRFPAGLQTGNTAVRIGGLSCTALPWHWGYGRPTCE
jgi:hypothetical protein